MRSVPESYIDSMRKGFLGIVGARSDSNNVLRGLSIADAALLIAFGRLLGVRTKKLLQRLYVYNSSTDVMSFTEILRDLDVPLKSLCSSMSSAVSAMRQFYVAHGAVDLSSRKHVEKRVRDLASLADVRNCLDRIVDVSWTRLFLQSKAIDFHTSGVAILAKDTWGLPYRELALEGSNINLMAVPAVGDPDGVVVFVSLNSANFYGYHDDMDKVRFLSPYVAEVASDYVASFLQKYSNFCKSSYFPTVCVSY